MKQLILASGIFVYIALTPSFCPARAEEGDSGAKRFFNIQNRTIGDALNTFAMQADSEILFSSELAKDKQTLGLQGEYTRQEALEKLLEGSGLKAEEAGLNIYVVQVGAHSAGFDQNGTKNGVK